MENVKDEFVTKVVFRKDTTKEWFGEIYALFPEIEESKPGTCQCYAHIGQHSVAHYQYCMKNSTSATEAEYKALFEELESIGYNLKVIKKYQRK